MFKKTMVLFAVLTLFKTAKAQTNGGLDSLTDYDALFNELASFIDSLTTPRSFTTVNVGVSNGFFQYQPSGTTTIEEVKRAIVTPSVGYYNKSGFGVSAVASITNDADKWIAYQTAATASYDYLKNRKLLTGLSFTHFFTKQNLSFYTSPLNNQVYTYVSYRGWWLKPVIAAGYGWGSMTSVEERKEKIKLLRGRRLNSTTTTETVEDIADLSVSASVKHDFYWLNVASKRDYFRLSPQLVVTGGTQRYGLAQTNNSYVSEKASGNQLLYNTEHSFISGQSRMQIVSLSGRIRTEYSKGMFFIQPQLLFDYYFPEQNKKVYTSFVLNAGVLF